MTSTPSSLGIWPPYEAFYVEAMLFCTTAVFNAENEINVALAFGAKHTPESAEWQQASRVVVDGIQELVVQAAALSRFLWPPGREVMHQDRGTRLRSSLGIGDESPLRNRDLRNQLEHLDEHLDRFCREFRAGVVLPTWVGQLGPEPEVPTTLFRAYYTDVGVFEVLGKRYEVLPILKAVRELHEQLVHCSSRGGRLPRDL